MPSFFIETFGCQMNTADSETIGARLQQRGFIPVEDYTAADLIIVNTCSVRANAEERALARISQYAHFKRRHKKDCRLWVVGCMAGRLGQKLIAQIPQVDRVIGAERIPEIEKEFESLAKPLLSDGPSLSRPGAVSCFIPIMRGCNNFCTYCIVPYVRGREKSIPAAQIRETVSAAVLNGTREITLLGQNVNSYTDGSCDFPALLTQLHAIEGLRRIRFMTSHPKDLNARLIRTLAGLAKVCRHIHLPVQSGSSRILKLMNRGYSREEYLKKIDLIRANLPDADITTDIITGFPGETETDFDDTISLVKHVRFVSAFTFAYSPRGDTKAALLKNDIPPALKQERLSRIIGLQNAITAEQYAAMTGKTVDVLFTIRQSRRSRAWMGIDMGCKRVLLPCAENLSSMILPITVIASTGKTLLGKRN